MFKGPRYTESELMARLKFTVGLSLAFTLTGIVFVVLYSLIFVTQPTPAPATPASGGAITPEIAALLEKLGAAWYCAVVCPGTA